MTTQRRIDELRTQAQQVNAEIAFLGQLPMELPVRVSFKLGQRWHVQLESGTLAEHLTTLPPQGLELVADGWDNYTAHPSEEAAQPDALVHPVWVTRGELHWYTKVQSGQLVHVTLPAAGAGRAEPLGYTNHSRCAQYWVRQREAPVLHTEQGPAAEFHAKWAAFFEQEGYTAAQLQMGRVFSTASSRDVLLSDADLPVRSADTMEFAGEKLVVLSAGLSLVGETYPVNSNLWALQRIGHFWSRFTPAQATKLLAFSNESKFNLESAETEFIRKVLAGATALANEFFQKHVQTQKNSPNGDALEYFIQSALGQDVKVSLRKEMTRNQGDQVLYSFWLHFRRFNEGFSASVPAVYDPQGLDWDFPSFVKYLPTASAAA